MRSRRALGLRAEALLGIVRTRPPRRGRVRTIPSSASARRPSARRDRMGPFASDYRQPFGTFAGRLAAGVALAEGFGVMERHSARW